MNTIKTADGADLYIDDGYIQSIDPPETLFGFTYWASMIPPTKPERMLILGYGNGTVAKLTRKIWWKDFKVYGVDLAFPSEIPWDSDTFPLITHQCDAYKFVTECEEEWEQTYDFIVVDLYNGLKVCDFIFDEKFVKRLSEIATLRIAVNVFEQDFERIAVYDHFFKHELTKSVLRNRVSFFKKP